MLVQVTELSIVILHVCV